MVEGERAESIRRAAKEQWGQDPAGANALGDEELGTPASFAKVERHRYVEQPWMRATFGYHRFSGQRVLEIGVGLGTDHIQFARAGAQMNGIDLTPRCVELTRCRFEQEGQMSDLRVMDAEQLDFPDGSFDVVYSFGVLHHVPSAERAFAEVRRVLRSGGVFIGGVYNRHSLFVARVRAEYLCGGWRSESFPDRLARIEHSSPDNTAKPYVRLFSATELDHALRTAGFGKVRIVRRHSGLGELGRRLPARVDGFVGRIGGWYLIHEAS